MDWYTVWKYADVIWAGLVVTLKLSVGSIIGSFFLGTFVGSVHSLPGYFLHRLSGAYIEIMRNIPSLVKLFFFYYIVGLDAWPAAFLSLILHQSGYIADVTSSGLRSVPKEQIEAAYASGLSTWQSFGTVLLPQAIRYTIPPLTSNFIELAKTTSFVMLVGVQDLTFSVQNMQAETYRYLDSFIVVTLLYIGIMYAIVFSMRMVKARLDKGM